MSRALREWEKVLFKKQWENICERLKNSGADLGKIRLVTVEDRVSKRDEFLKI